MSAKVSQLLSTISMLVIVVAGSLTGCGENSMAPLDGIALHYDNGPLSAPFLEAGTYQAAVRFTSAEIGNLRGREILQIQFYIVNKPDNCTVRIFEAGSATSPGMEIYTANLGDDITAGDWNYHTLTQSLALPGEDIWISVEFDHSSRQAVFGCDPGPAVTDGDWLYGSDDQQWLPLSQRTTTSINWNLRAIIAGG